jgi:hypothetical protein
VHHQRISLANSAQVVAGLAPRYHEVFRVYLEPVDSRVLIDHVLEMIRTQTETKPEIRLA